jgi:hypothetical protein
VKVNYEVTEAQLLGYGLSQRIIDLAKQPFIRSGARDFDVQYALSVWNAKDEVSLAALAINNPNEKSIGFPPHDPYMGLVR